MVGVHTRNKALKKSEMVFTANLKANTGSDKPKTRMNRNGIMRLATRKKITDDVQNQTRKARQKKGGEVISSILAQSETVCETNSQCQNTKQKKLEETIRLLIEEISNKDKKLSDNKTTIERMTRREK